MDWICSGVVRIFAVMDFYGGSRREQCETGVGMNVGISRSERQGLMDVVGINTTMKKARKSEAPLKDTRSMFLRISVDLCSLFS